MTRWRSLALILAVLSFLLAAGGSPEIAAWAPLLGTWLPRAGGMPFFWLGVLLFLAAGWGRGG